MSAILMDIIFNNAKIQMMFEGRMNISLSFLS